MGILVNHLSEAGSGWLCLIHATHHSGNNIALLKIELETSRTKKSSVTCEACSILQLLLRNMQPTRGKSQLTCRAHFHVS